jgi:hypothetical protein
MPVQKFRTFEEASDALWVDRDDPRLVQRLAWVLAFTPTVAPRAPFPPGVRKYRSLAEAQLDREKLGNNS